MYLIEYQGPESGEKSPGLLRRKNFRYANMLAISLPLNWGQGMLFFLAMGTILGAWGIIRVANSIS
ncbi:MAG: hypothetical protein VCF07_03585, partial [Nitrospinota bacterium]